GGRRGHEEAIFSEACGRAVIEHEAIFSQHHAITRASNRQGRKGVDVQPIEKGSGIRAVNLDLAEGGYVAESNAGTDGANLAVHRLSPISLAGAREVLSAQPQSCFHEDGALLLCPRVRWGQPRRPELLAAVVARERADRDRRIGRPESRSSG